MHQAEFRSEKAEAPLQQQQAVVEQCRCWSQHTWHWSGTGLAHKLTIKLSVQAYWRMRRYIRVGARAQTPIHHHWKEADRNRLTDGMRSHANVVNEIMDFSWSTLSACRISLSRSLSNESFWEYIYIDMWSCALENLKPCMHACGRIVYIIAVQNDVALSHVLIHDLGWAVVSTHSVVCACVCVLCDAFAFVRNHKH